MPRLSGMDVSLDDKEVGFTQTEIVVCPTFQRI